MRILKGVVALAVLLTLAPRHAHPESNMALQEFSGERIVAVTTVGSSMSSGEFRELVTLREGDELLPARIRDSVLNLFRTGLFEQIKVTGTRSGEGVVVHFTLVPRRWLDRVAFVGNLGVGDSDLLRTINLGLEQEVEDERLMENIERVMDYYAFRGYESAEVGYRVETDDEQRSKIIFSILEGERSQISDIRLTGDAGFSRLKLLSMISSAMGREFDGQRLDRDQEEIATWLKKRGYYYPIVIYQSQPDSVDPINHKVVFEVNRGEKFNLEVRGQVEKDTGKIRKWMMAAYIESDTEADARDVVAKKVQKRYVNSGYHFTSVTWEEARVAAGVREVTMVVNRGDQATISVISVEGVDRLDVEQLGDILTLETEKPFIRQDVDKALLRLEDFYREDGYLDADASLAPLEFLPANNGRTVKIDIQVSEGDRTVIGEIKISGGPFSAAEVMKLIGSGVGDPYVPERIQEGRERLLLKLGSDGYLYSSVTIAEPVRSESGAVILAVEIAEGPQVRVGSIVITGNEQVDTRIIRLALALERGELLDLDKVIKAQERVYRLGMMASVDISLADRETPEAEKDILVNIKERNRYAVNFKVGYGNEDRFRSEVSATWRNVARMARTLTLGARTSEIENQTSITYGHPWFLERPIDLTASVIDLEEKRESYSRDSVSVLVDFTREVSDYTTTRLAYSFEGLRLFDVSPGAQLSPEDEGQTDVAAIIPEILFDSRDDFLEPRTGILADIRLEFADEGLGSQAEFYKIELSGRKYTPILGSSVLAMLFRLGYVRSYGDSEEVIISKRFFLGGQNSVRGYELDSLGPLDADDDPIGGNYLVNANVELRYPLFGTFGGVVFMDSGSVWLREGVSNELKLRMSAGAGLRWSSPIGPLSVDYGYKLNPAVGDVDLFRWHFSIGHAF